MTFIPGLTPRPYRSTEDMANRARLLLVEDHPATARALKMYLETQGYIVMHAGNVASAINAAKTESFNLFICDLSLPDGTGWDLMKKLSSNGPVRAIAFTASDSYEDIARSKKVGFLKHVVKGCAGEELTAVIDEVLKTEPKPTPSRVAKVAKKRKAAKP